MTGRQASTNISFKSFAGLGVKQATDPLAESVTARLYGDNLIKTYDYFGGDRELHPSSVCLAEMVEEFMEEQCRRPLCKCFDGESRGHAGKSALGGEVYEILKGLVTCVSEQEKNVLADTSEFVKAAGDGANLSSTGREGCFNGCLQTAVVKRLRTAGYNAALCKSRWDPSFEYPAGEYEYIDIIMEESTGKPERLVVDIDFRSQFEIARPTACYLGVSNMLPVIFIGKEDRLQQVVRIVSYAAKQSLKKRGLHIPPWRKCEYMRAKWFSSYKRTAMEEPRVCGEFGMHQGSIPRTVSHGRSVQDTDSAGQHSTGVKNPQQITAVVTDWEPPAVKPKPLGAKVAGLASVLKQASQVPQFRCPEVA